MNGSEAEVVPIDEAVGDEPDFGDGDGDDDFVEIRRISVTVGTTSIEVVGASVDEASTMLGKAVNAARQLYDVVREGRADS